MSEIEILTKSVERLVLISTDQSTIINELKERINRLENRVEELEYHVDADTTLHNYMYEARFAGIGETAGMVPHA